MGSADALTLEERGGLSSYFKYLCTVVGAVVLQMCDEARVEK